MAEKLVNAIADMQEDIAISLVQEMAAAGTEPMAILGQVREAMDIIGSRYEKGIYFLPELIMAGEMMGQIKEILKTDLTTSANTRGKGRILIGTIVGDIHNIGKDIVAFMLEANGYEVMDLGVDVPAEKFIQGINDFNPQVVGISGFLTLAFEAMKNTIGEFENKGLRSQFKVMIGGGQMDDQVRVYTGADGYGKDAMEAVNMVRNWIGG